LDLATNGKNVILKVLKKMKLIFVNDSEIGIANIANYARNVCIKLFCS